ncbi:phage antirepressor KilAC domain-containing protein [uncultured Prevotella sp.]|uniref:phage antirepressor n=1 Tax=uncultured Prevotella sp. TaxID=159272 RepID=UPI00258CB75B|nr:phage antirepressor KilAC domain-containing protein [uncultured Prevotella sp.]
MNNEFINFHHEMFGDIRAIEKDGEPWFVGKDVAVALGYSRTADAVAAHVDAEDKGVGKIPTPGGEQDVTIINESGLYSLVLSSKLPSIRRHGAYATAPTIEKIIASPEFGIALLKNLQQEQNMRREAELRVRRLQPLADYTALILACPETVSVSQVAQDYGMSAVAFNRILNRAGIQYSVGGQWVLYAAYKDRGLVQSYTFNYRHNDGTDGCKMYTRWTQRGRLFLYDILKKIGIIPMIEKTTDNED